MADVTGKATNQTSTAYADPLLTFMFELDATIPDPDNSGSTIDIKGYFTEITGPSESVNLVEFRTVGYEGNDKGKPKKFRFPGRSSQPEITLKRGLTNDTTFWKWWKLIKQGKLSDATIDVTIQVYNRLYEPLVKWELADAWPQKIAMPTLQAGSSDFGVEEITLTFGSLGMSSQVNGTWTEII